MFSLGVYASYMPTTRNFDYPKSSVIMVMYAQIWSFFPHKELREHPFFPTDFKIRMFTFPNIHLAVTHPSTLIQMLFGFMIFSSTINGHTFLCNNSVYRL